MKSRGMAVVRRWRMLLEVSGLLVFMTKVLVKPY